VRRKPQAPASSLVDNRPANGVPRLCQYPGAVDANGRTCCERRERKLMSTAAGTFRGTRKVSKALCRGSPIQEQIRAWKREARRKAGRPGKSQEEGTSRPTSASSIMKRQSSGCLFFIGIPSHPDCPAIALGISAPAVPCKRRSFSRPCLPRGNHS